MFALHINLGYFRVLNLILVNFKVKRLLKLNRNSNIIGVCCEIDDNRVK